MRSNECRSMNFALAKKHQMTGYSGLRKADLIAHIRTADDGRLQLQIFPTWWQTYHNHVYGVVSVFGVLLSVVFFVWPTYDGPKPS